jgi:hypothetical protein
MTFAYTMRELQHHNRRFLLAGLAVSATLIVLWVLWFFAAPLTLYESSDTAVIQSDGSVVAQVEPAIATQLYQGQPARFRITLNGLPQNLSARVLNVTDTVAVAQPSNVTLLLNDVPPELRAALFDGRAGRIDFETRQVTPAQLIFEAVGNNA